MQEDIQISIRRKKVHEIRFINIVVTLSYYDVSWKYFNETLRYLCKSELSDIVDERNGLDKCGYVMCDNVNHLHPTATVSLDIPDKKIYNISIRKKFCSDWCYGAFKFISEQLPDEPTWKVGVKLSCVFKPYPITEKGCKGEIHYEDDCAIISKDNVNISGSIIKNQTITNISNENIINKDKPIEENISVHKSKTIDNEKIDRIQSVIHALDNLATSKKKDLNEIIKKVNISSEMKKERKLIFIDDNSINYDKNKNVATNEHDDVYLNKVLESISEWFTDETRTYLISDKEEEQIENTEIVDQNIMPSIDSYDQSLIRRSIILRRIQSCATPIIADFGIDNNSFHIELVKFMKTCRLSSHNILFSAKELKYLIIVLIELLMEKLSTNVSIVKEESLKKYGIENITYYEDILSKMKTILNIDEDKNKLISSQGDF